MDLSQFKQKFIEEADSLLSNLDNALIELEKNPSDVQYVNEAFRVMHTIKGTSGMYGFSKVVEVTHEIESLYDMVRDNKMEVTQLLLDLTFAAADHIRALLVDENFENESNQIRHSQITQNIELIKQGLGINSNIDTFSHEAKTDPESLATWNILFFPNDELIHRCVNLTYTFQDLFALGEYKISSYPSESDTNQNWSIFLITNKTRDDIESALMFVMDYFIITKVANFDIFDPELLDKRDQHFQVTTVKTSETKAEEDLKPRRRSSEITKELKQNFAVIKENSPRNMAHHTTTRINVDASKLDQLMYLVSELVTTKSELTIALKSFNDTKALDAAEKIDKLSRMFSENALDIRLVSLHDMLNKFRRLIRDLARDLGKSIDFITIGEDTELDKNIIDSLAEPIMHLLRNCIDHGIELPEARLEQNKPETGIIRFEAFKTGNNVYINISDDGKGIDKEAVYQKAADKGLIQPNAQLSEKEIFDIIFLPGFSTAQSLSNVSGRGVGMDIVRRKIHEVRGDISITSQAGIGTTFSLKLQQTISIINTLLIKSGLFTYAIPIENIESCSLEATENIMNRQNKLIQFENELIPFLNLREHFSFFQREDELVRETEKLIILNKQDKRYALIADTIIGEYQAVVKPIGKAFSDIKFLSGASLLGDGSIALLIDTDKLWYELAG
ncbi:MAG TPA: chemotaxis protein CheA [Bacteroidales bacterium]|nr:chemotaxis protein CheA [Bacteroidales bacterium]